MFVHFTSYNTKHNPPENHKMECQKYCFSIGMGFQITHENEFHTFGNLVIRLWKSLENISKKSFCVSTEIKNEKLLKSPALL